MKIAGSALFAGWLAVVGVECAGITAAAADEHFRMYNLSTSIIFTGVYLAPMGTTQWGRNQVINDKNQTIESSEELHLDPIPHRKYDVKVTWRDDHGSSHTCVKTGIDLTLETSFDIRDSDLADCY